jgi:hypothetical protein
VEARIEGGNIPTHRKLIQPSPDAELIPDQYILIFRDEVQNVIAKVKALLNIASERFRKEDDNEPSVLYTFDDKYLKVATISRLNIPTLFNILNDDEILYAEQVSPGLVALQLVRLNAFL